MEGLKYGNIYRFAFSTHGAICLLKLSVTSRASLPASAKMFFGILLGSLSHKSNCAWFFAFASNTDLNTEKRVVSSPN